MAADRSSPARRGTGAEHSDAAESDHQRGPRHGDHDGRSLGANPDAGHGPDSAGGGRADDSLPSSVARFDALVGVLERRGLLGRAVAIHSGDLDVKLAPLGPVLPLKPVRDVLEEGEKKKELEEELMYSSS